MDSKFCSINLFFLGVHPSYPLRKWHCIFNITLLLYLLLLATFKCYHDKSLEAVEILSCTILVLVKYMMLVFDSNLIRQIVKTTKYFWKLEVTDYEVKFFLNHLKRVENMCKFMFIFGAFAFSVKPFIVKGSSIFDCYVPPEIPYPLYYILEFYLVAVGSSSFISLNIFVCSLIILVAVQFRFLNLKIKDLNFEEVERNNDFDRIVEDLKSIIKYQQFLMRYVKDLNKLLTVPIALMMITSVFLLSANMYILSMKKGFGVDDGRAVSTSFVLIIEFFMVYGLPSQFLMDESAATADIIYYECKWYIQKLKPLRKNFLIMIFRSQKSVYIRAGNYHVINNRTILLILRTAYSFYTFLQNVS